jgi:arginyl-tRNA synthetase
MLVEKWKSLQTEIKEDEAAQKKLKKAAADLEKTKAKPAEKLKPGEVEKAEAALKAAEQKAAKEHDDVVKASAEYAELKINTLKTAMDAFVSEQKLFYANAMKLLEGSQKQVSNIDVKKEVDAVAAATPESLENTST